MFFYSASSTSTSGGDGGSSSGLHSKNCIFFKKYFWGIFSFFSVQYSAQATTLKNLGAVGYSAKKR
jgi:hypothetical protein